MKGGRKLSQWNLFVKKIYQEGKSKNTNYQFKHALEDASKRKSEMGSLKNSTVSGGAKSKKSFRNSKGKRSMAGGKTRRRRRH